MCPPCLPANRRSAGHHHHRRRGPGSRRIVLAAANSNCCRLPSFAAQLLISGGGCQLYSKVLRCTHGARPADSRPGCGCSLLLLGKAPAADYSFGPLGQRRKEGLGGELEIANNKNNAEPKSLSLVEIYILFRILAQHSLPFSLARGCARDSEAGAGELARCC